MHRMLFSAEPAEFFRIRHTVAVGPGARARTELCTRVRGETRGVARVFLLYTHPHPPRHCTAGRVPCELYVYATVATTMQCGVGVFGWRDPSAICYVCLFE